MHEFGIFIKKLIINIEPFFIILLYIKRNWMIIDVYQVGNTARMLSSGFFISKNGIFFDIEFFEHGIIF